MNPWQATFFGLKQIPRELTAFEIEAFFTFTATERQVIVRYDSGPRLQARITVDAVLHVSPLHPVSHKAPCPKRYAKHIAQCQYPCATQPLERVMVGSVKHHACAHCHSRHDNRRAGKVRTYAADERNRHSKSDE